MKCTIENTGANVADPSVHMLRNAGVEGISREPDRICTGRNGGYQAINIALLAGAERVVLLGYDMQYTEGKSHWHGDHPLHVPEQWYTQSYAPLFKAFVDCGVPVINASRSTRIAALPRMTIEEALLQ